MRALLVAILCCWYLKQTSACRKETVSYSQSYSTRCGFWGWSRCRRYRVAYKEEYVDCLPDCNGEWTQFFDRDNPGTTGDWETLNYLRSENPGKICEKPSAVYAETTTGVPAELTGETFFAYGPEQGLVCRMKDQSDGRCMDYRVKFCCRDCDGMLTQFFDRDDPTGQADAEDLQNLRREYPGLICPNPSAIYAETLDGVSAESTGEIFSQYNPTSGFSCFNDQQPDKQCMDYRVRFCCPAESCSRWTRWYDRDNPGGVGDWETLDHLRNEYRDEICESPRGMQVRKKQSGEIVTPDDGNFRYFDTTAGFACRNMDQHCEDYEVRFCCPYIEGIGLDGDIDGDRPLLDGDRPLRG